MVKVTEPCEFRVNFTPVPEMEAPSPAPDIVTRARFSGVGGGLPALIVIMALPGVTAEPGVVSIIDRDSTPLPAAEVTATRTVALPPAEIGIGFWSITLALQPV